MAKIFSLLDQDLLCPTVPSRQGYFLVDINADFIIRLDLHRKIDTVSVIIRHFERGCRFVLPTTPRDPAHIRLTNLRSSRMFLRTH